MVNDHLSDFVTRVRNGYRSERSTVEIPDTKMVRAVAKVLADEGYISGTKKDEGKLWVLLKYENHQPAITGIVRVSKPSARIYKGISELPRVLGGLGIHVLSTPKGILSEKSARKQNAGGEVLLKVW